MSERVPGPHRPSPVATIDPEVYRRRWWILAVLCTSLMIVIVGNTALNIALPSLARDLGASSSELQWMVDAYSLVFAGLLLTAGAIGDRFGRRGSLQVGLVVFLAGSVFAATGNAAWMVIVARIVMGVGGAFIMPATLSILTNVFPAHERAKAIAVWAGIAGAGAAIGPISSGFLLEHFWWGSVFLVNVPIIAVSLAAGLLLLPTSRDPDHGKLDPLGAALSMLALGSLVYAIIEAPDLGWGSGTSLAWFAGAAAALAAFFVWELRCANPMLDLHLFSDRRFGVASGGITLVFFAMFGVFFLLTQYFQLVLGYGTLEAGLKQGPIALVMMLIAPQTPRLAQRIGGNRVVALGLGFVACGLLLFSRLHIDTGYSVLLAPMLVMASGMALTMSPLTSSLMAAVPLGKAGVGSAMNDTTRELGGALGVAVLGSLVVSRYDSHLRPAVAGLDRTARATAESSLSGALQVAARLGPDGAALRVAARQAFMDGMSTACVAGAAVVAVAAVLVYRYLPGGQTEARRVPVTERPNLQTV